MKFQVSSFKFQVQRALAALLIAASSVFAASGDWQIGVKNDAGQLVAKNITLSNGQVLGKSGGLPAAITPFSGIFADLSSKPTTLAGYGITDSITAALAASTYEPIITAGTTGQYFRGDKSWQTLNSAAVGLGNVENTALSTWAGSTNLSTLGTITAGTWQGSIIAPAYLGTGSSITTKFLRGDGTWQTVESGLTIGTTAVTGGSNGNALIVADGILQQRGYSAGGGGALDGNKLATYDENGKINTSSGFAVYQVADGLRYHVVFAEDLTAADRTITFTFGDADRAYTFPTSGTLIGSNDTGTVTSTIIANSTIVDGDISNSAAIAISKLASSSITIAGTVTSLGGTISLDTITGLSTTGLVKRTGANTLAISTLDANAETWIGTPSKANLNAAVSDDDPAYVGAANTFTAAQTVTAGTNSPTPADGLQLKNTTAAISGTQSASPRFILTGQGYKTGGTPGSQALDWSIYNLPVQASSSDTSLIFSYRVAGGSWVDQMRLNGTDQVHFRGLAFPQTFSLIPSFSSNATKLDIAGSSFYFDVSSATKFSVSNSSSTLSVPSGWNIGWASSSTTAGTNDTSLTRVSAGVVGAPGLRIGSTGSSIGVVKRTNVTLVAGTATVSDTATTANTQIVMSVLTPLGTVGSLDFDLNAGTGYTINSSNVLDVSTIVITAIHYP